MRLNDLDFCAFRQPINTIGNDAIACRQACADHHVSVILNTDFYPLLADVIFVIQHPHKVALIAHLHRRGRHHNGILFGIDQHPGVHKLIGEQRIVLIGKACFNFDRSRRGINLVVQTEQHTFAQFVRVSPIPGFYDQRFPRFLCLNYGRDIAFRQSKNEINRVRLRNDDNTCGIAAGNLVADIHLFQTHASRDRGRDTTPVEL